MAHYVKTFLSNIFLLIFKGTVISQLKGLALLSAILAPIGFIEPIRCWFLNNNGYIRFVLFAIALDHIIGTLIHLFWKHDFSIKRNALGLLLKLFAVFAVTVVFEGINFIYAEENILSQYLSITTRLIVFLYPAVGVLKNLSIMTNGKFPSIGMIKKIARFNHSLDLNEFEKPLKKERKNNE